MEVFVNGGVLVRLKIHYFQGFTVLRSRPYIKSDVWHVTRVGSAKSDFISKGALPFGTKISTCLLNHQPNYVFS